MTVITLALGKQHQAHKTGLPIKMKFIKKQKGEKEGIVMKTSPATAGSGSGLNLTLSSGVSN